MDLCGFCIEEWEKLLLSYIGRLICREAQKTNNPNPYFLCSKWSTWLYFIWVKIHVLHTKLRTKNKQINKWHNPATWDFPKYFFIADCFLESDFLGGTTVQCEVNMSQKQVIGKQLLLFLLSIAAHASVSTTHVRILHLPLCHFIVSLLRAQCRD